MSGAVVAAIARMLADGKDEIEICHELKLKRWELGTYGRRTGAWTAEQWDGECARRGYMELIY